MNILDLIYRYDQWGMRQNHVGRRNNNRFNDPNLLLISVGVDTEFLSCVEGTRASWKGPLDGARDPPSFSAGVVDPTHSSRDVPVNLTLQLTRRESLSVI